MTHQHCPVCGQVLASPLVIDDYWTRLEDAMSAPPDTGTTVTGYLQDAVTRAGGSGAGIWDEDEPRPVPDDDEGQLHELRPSAMNNGYYQAFFREDGLIGRGAFGSVFRVTHILDDVVLGRYAVKRVAVGDSRPWLHRVIREVHALEALAHPNVIKYHHSWLESFTDSAACPRVPHLFLLLDLADGGGLDEFVRQTYHAGTPPPFPVVLAMARGVAAGMAHLHSLSVLHRDVKPENVLLDRRLSDIQSTWDTSDPVAPTVLLSDFGQCGDAASDSADGQTGTIEFMAPEKIADAAASYTASMDMYSIGLTLYYLAHGGLPPAHLNIIEQAGLDADPYQTQAAPVTRPEWFDAVVARCLASPDDRPSAAEVVEGLREEHIVASPPPRRGMGVGGVGWAGVGFGAGMVVTAIAARLLR